MNALAPRKQITFDVSGTVHSVLTKLAREKGHTTSAYACMLFEAAYAARVTPSGTGDRNLDAAVARAVVLFAGGIDTAIVSTITGLSEPTILKVLGAWRKEVGRQLQ